jgi:putative aldouronate transport system permease protein
VRTRRGAALPELNIAFFRSLKYALTTADGPAATKRADRPQKAKQHNEGGKSLQAPLHQRGQRTVIQLFWKYRWLYLMLIPGILYLVMFKYTAVVNSIIAFKDYKIFKGIWNSPWVGMENFDKLWASSNFWRIFRNTLIISGYKILFGFTAPIVFALMLNEIESLAYKRTIQTVAYLPHFLSWIIISSLAVDLFSVNDGVVNQIRQLMNLQPIFFLGDNGWFRFILVITDIWKEMGWGAIIYLAALSGVPTEMYEAATIDGANKWQKMTRITLPCLIPTIVVMLVLRCGSIMNAGFEQVFALYSPAVYSSGDIIDTYVYRVGIVNTDYGFSAAVGLFKSVISCALVVLCNVTAKRLGQEGLF